jgi:hypothetical protein
VPCARSVGVLEVEARTPHLGRPGALGTRRRQDEIFTLHPADREEAERRHEKRHGRPAIR